MDAGKRIEQALRTALAAAGAPEGPPKLAAAIEYAVFPGGARVRPRLCLAVAGACGDDEPALAEAVAASVELLHCASLVHDDLPCFDDAQTRRGRPSLHRAFGVPLAVLAGDALIIRAFELVARASVGSPLRLAGLLTTIGAAVGGSEGLVAGQAWESEPEIDLEQYHQAKTSALFVAATAGGALAAGADPTPWRAVGQHLGAAYQVADDLCDAVSEAETSGKTAGRDQALGRPSAVRAYGIEGAVDRLEAHVANAVAAVPDCPGADQLCDLVRLQAKRLVPKQLAWTAA
ncbi:MAG: polyprenyl synthetase family protein [Maricaulaceae bacterium]